jgi:hypothetical protein
VLQTLRDRLTVEEAAQLAAQLPMLVRGLYYEGWNPTVVPVDMDSADFLARVQAAFGYESEGEPGGWSTPSSTPSSTTSPRASGGTSGPRCLATWPRS